MRIAKTPAEKKEWQEHQKDKNAKAPFEDSTPENAGKLWVTYKLNLSTNFGFHQKQRYEWFCAGFLAYYDDILRNAAVDHIMTFKWESQSVTINLSPAPEYRKLVDGKLKYPNWGQLDPQLLLSGYGDLSDPPPPPPPPPPPMND